MPTPVLQLWAMVGGAGTSCNSGNAKAEAPEAASLGPGHSLSLSRPLPAGSCGEAVGEDLAASPLGVAPEIFPGNVGYLCSTRKGPSYWKEREREPQTQLGNLWMQKQLPIL